MSAVDRADAPAVEVILDQVFSHAGGKDRLADLYLPQGLQQKCPVIIWVHGGGWRRGNRRLAPDLRRYFAELGFAMISFDYRSSDEITFPAQVIDTKTAIRWVRSVADTFNLDADRVGLWGSSAGANLAAMVALSGEDQFDSDEYAGFSAAVQAVVDGYGPTDFSLIDADRQNARPLEKDAESVLVRDVLPSSDPDSFESRYLGSPVGTSQEKVQAANPANYARAGAAPFLIMHGQSDALVPWQQSRLLFEALRKAGAQATLVLLQRLGHGFFINPRLNEIDPGEVTIHETHPSARVSYQTQPGFELVEAFFRKHLFEATT